MSSFAPFSPDALLFAGIFAIALTVALVVVVLLLRQRQQLDIYNHELRRVALPVMRENYEEQIADLNARLLATEERWKDVNHLLLDSQRKLPADDVDPRVSTERFLRRFGIDLAATEVDPKLIFALTPFSQREASTYRVMQTVAQRIGFRCVRGDEEFKRDEILPHVVDLMVRARIVIANISGRNPNVYYELGIAHALGKPTILLSRSLDSVPFDLRAKYIVLFENNQELEERLRDAVARLLAAMD